MLDQITGHDIFSPLTIGTRFLAMMIASFFIGFERGKHNQPAGLRTHMVIALGGCLVMIISLYITAEFMKQNPNIDPTRLPAQVISGIGFLGAGAIFKYGFTIRGLTTAASIWTVSGIGIAFGAGLYVLGFIASIMLIIILQVFDTIEDWLIERRDLRLLTIVFESKAIGAENVISVVKQYDLNIKHISITENVQDGTSEITVDCRMEQNFSTRKLFTKIKALGNIKTISIT